MTTMAMHNWLEFREVSDNPDVAATFEGLAVPYGESTTVGAIREEFAPGAFDPAEVIGKPLCWRHGEPIGLSLIHI
jgi:hypothetical protein